MMRVLVGLLLLAATLVGFLWAGEHGYGPVVITREDQYKVIIGLTGPKAIFSEPGWDPNPLTWKMPIVDRLYTFDNRLRYLNAKPVRVLIANNEELIIDYYALWKISEPLRYLENFPRGEESAEDRIQEVVKSLVGSKIGRLTLAQLLQRTEVLTELYEESSRQLAGTGVEIVDVRLNRTELPPKAVAAAYEQMREQRNAIAREHRAQGNREAREVRAEADRLAISVVAQANADAARLRGDGDAEAARVYAAAYSKDPEFYAFVRSLEAFRKTLGDGTTTMVVSPDHEFFRFLNLDFSSSKGGLPPVSLAPPTPTSNEVRGEPQADVDTTVASEFATPSTPSGRPWQSGQP